MIKLAGVNKIDLDDMRKYTLQSGFNPEEDQIIITWFWEIIEQMDNH